jgi:hypothetical protein
MDSKACTKCGAVKPLSEFPYKRHQCKKCAHKINELTRKKNGKKYFKSDFSKKIHKQSEVYVKNLLINQGFTRDQITPELIELKREQLELKRLSKQLKQAVKNDN